MTKETMRTLQEEYMRYKKAYYDVRSLLDHMIIQDAIIFAHKNPDVVFGKDSNLSAEVKNGFLSTMIDKIFKRELDEASDRSNKKEAGCGNT